MRHFISATCCLIVGLQVLIGVPLVVCVAFHLLMAGDVLGPVSVEYHSSHAGAPVTIPPPNRIPSAVDAAVGNPILQSRIERGSPLAGTVLESDSLQEEQSLFVAAVEKAAAERTSEPTNSPAIEPGQPVDLSDHIEQANQFAVSQLYAMADMDEQAGLFDRADQWRALAREVRGQTALDQTPDSAAIESLSKRPATSEVPR